MESSTKSNMTKPTYTSAIRRAAAATTAAACLLAGNAFAALNVLLDVNSGKPPKEIMVVFDKTAKDAKSFKPTDRKGNAKFSFADDGALQIKITRLGSELVFPFPQEIDIAKASLVLFTTKLEGQFRNSWQGNWGPWTPYTGSKMWWAAFVLDADGQRSAGYANFDAVSPDGFSPAETTTIRIPAMFFTRQAEGFGDPARTAALMLAIGEQRDTHEREYTITIDRIAIAE